ncbi:MAG: hypothetical protein IT219_00040 [Bacteroidales bacterium]|nr:hypothetical protein [Bacteroidales bacterium]
MKTQLQPLTLFILRSFAMIQIMVFVVSCHQESPEAIEDIPKTTNSEPWCVEGINELRRGDILVRPNLNIWPGTATLANGKNFGHAAIVVKGFKHNNMDSLLMGTTIVESIAKEVPKALQVREIAGLVYHKFDALNNVNFDHTKKGSRYRLRLPLTEEQIDKMIDFALHQKGDSSSWHAAKYIPLNERADTLRNFDSNTSWYCSLLVWSSVYYATGIDIDCTAGYMVYPNDLIASPAFCNNEDHIGRARF